MKGIDMPRYDTQFTRDTGVELPIICGAMYPCSNPELIAAVSGAGAMGIIQPISMEFVHKFPLARGIDRIRQITDRPVGFNAIVEKSSKKYEDRMRRWIDIALDKGIRFFITALGNPSWVVAAVHARGGKVYHDVTELKWAQKALDKGVDGLICVNNRAGGHTGSRDIRELFDTLSGFGVPLVCAGGIGEPGQFREALDMGYAAIQMGTRFIATRECTAHDDYKQAILDAEEADIVLTEKISGVPVSVIKTPYIEQMGTRAGWLARRLLRHPKGKHYMRMLYTLKSIWQLKQASVKGMGYKAFYQAGKSVSPIRRIVSVEELIKDFAAGPAINTPNA
ncbi:MAG TPA: 2-nitropropane dioxygenase [Desulfobacteraceae bacterium]|nr:2-nitropropane dioxygenase [Desulfobacteraceae bacterium]